MSYHCRCLYGLVSERKIIDYCINNNIGFHEGEIVGLAAGLQLKVEKSKGCNVDEDGETLKLSFL